MGATAGPDSGMLLALIGAPELSDAIFGITSRVLITLGQGLTKDKPNEASEGKDAADCKESTWAECIRLLRHDAEEHVRTMWNLDEASVKINGFLPRSDHRG